MKLLTHQPNSLPAGFYVITLDERGAVATAVTHEAATPAQRLNLDPWIETLILLNGPLDKAAAVEGEHLKRVIKPSKSKRTIKDLIGKAKGMSHEWPCRHEKLGGAN